MWSDLLNIVLWTAKSVWDIKNKICCGIKCSRHKIHKFNYKNAYS